MLRALVTLVAIAAVTWGAYDGHSLQAAAILGGLMVWGSMQVYALYEAIRVAGNYTLDR